MNIYNAPNLIISPNRKIYRKGEGAESTTVPHCVVLWTQKLKTHLFKTLSLKVLPL